MFGEVYKNSVASKCFAQEPSIHWQRQEAEDTRHERLQTQANADDITLLGNTHAGANPCYIVLNKW